MIGDGEFILAEEFERLSLVDSEDPAVRDPDKLLGVCVVVRDKPVEDVFTLNDLDLDWRQLPDGDVPEGRL